MNVKSRIYGAIRRVKRAFEKIEALICVKNEEIDDYLKLMVEKENKIKLLEEKILRFKEL